MPNSARSGGFGNPKSLPKRMELPSPTTPTITDVRIPAVPIIRLNGILLDSHQPITSLALVTGASRRQRTEALSLSNAFLRGIGVGRLAQYVLCTLRADY